MVIKAFINYLKRFRQIAYVMPLVVLGALFEMFIMNSAEQASKAKMSLMHSEIVILGSLKNISLKQFAAASTVTYFIIIMSLVMIGFNISEKSKNIVQRIYASPVYKIQIFAGYILAQSFITFITGMFSIILIAEIYGINFGDSYFQIIFVIYLASLVSSCFGYLISAVFSSMKIAIGSATFILFFSAFLSDTFTLGQSFQAISKYTVNKYIYDCFFNIMNKKSFLSNLNNFIILSVFSVLCIIIGLIMYGRESKI